MKFNLLQFKTAKRGSEPPEVFTRPFFRERDVYDLTHAPNDGRGYKLTTPYSEGMPGDSPDMGSAAGGTRGRDGSPEPDDFSEFGSREDRDTRGAKSKLPSDSDPEKVFNPAGADTSQYEEGLQTEWGSAGHDAPADQRSDSAVSIERTVQRKMGPEGERDRKAPVSNMAPWNLKKKDDTIFKRVQRVQRRR